MNFSQKIYYNDKPLILTTDTEDYIDNNPVAETYSFFTGATLRSFTLALQQMDRPGVRGAVIEDVSEEALTDQLNAMYQSLDAGGGIVYNEHDAILMIFRRGKWDLPKGKLDEGESIGECALREVKEETGLEHVSMGDKICDTFHVYTQNNQQMLKRTAWYRMAGSSSDVLRPQKEENIMEAKWVTSKELGPLAARSYEAIREVLKIAGLKW
jgi:ADP-ribose pyrophosphatase YjhB (NUDIX family)